MSAARLAGVVVSLLTALALAMGRAGAQPPLPERAAGARIDMLEAAARFEEATRLATALAEEALRRRPLRAEAAVAALTRLADLLRGQARFTEAEAKAREALALAEAAFGRHDPRLAAPLNLLGHLALALSRPGEAESLFTRAMALREDAGMTEHPDVADSATGLAGLHSRFGDYPLAEAYARRALLLRQVSRGADSLRLAASLHDLGAILLWRDNEAEAEPLLRQAAASREQRLAPDHPDAGQSLAWLAYLHQRHNRFAEAAALFQKALSSRSRTFGESHLLTGDALYNLGILREAQQRLDEAGQLYLQALRIYEAALGGRSAPVANILRSLGKLHYAAGRYAEADDALGRSVALIEEIYGERYLGLPALLNEHGWALVKRGMLREATAVNERALTAAEKQPVERNALQPLATLFSLYANRGLYARAETIAGRLTGLAERHYPPMLQAIKVQLAEIYREQRKFRQANALYQEMLAQAEAEHGENHARTAFVLNILAGAYELERRYAEADAYYRRLLRVNERLYPPDDARQAPALGSYALLLTRRARFAEAEPYLRRAREIAEKAGDKALLANVAGYEAQHSESRGRYAEAERSHRQALALNQEVYGPDHPYIAVPMGNLAVVLQKLGRYEEAIALHERALALHRSQIEPDHPRAGVMLANLASALLAMDRFQRATELVREALAIFQKHAGSEPWVREQLSTLMAMDGRFFEALALQREVAAQMEAQLGADHPAFAQTLANLALRLVETGELEEAGRTAERGLAILERALGPDHPELSQLTGILARNRADRNQLVEAEASYRRTIAIEEASLGPDHPDTGLAYSNFAVFLEETGRAAEAESLLHRARAIFEKAFGPEHRLAVVALGNLATVLAELGRKPEAEALHRQTLALQEKLFGPDHPNTAWDLNNLAAFLTAQGRYDEALPLNERAARVMESVHGPDHPSLALALHNFGGTLGRLGRYDEAAPLLERALAIRERRLGPDHPLTAETLGLIAALRERRSGLDDVYPITRRAVGIVIDDMRRQHGRFEEAGQGRSVALEVGAKGLFDRHGRAAHWLAGKQPEQRGALQDEAFVVAQWAHQSAAAAALSQMSARFAKGETALAGLIRRRQDLVWRRQALGKLLIAESAKPAPARNGDAERALREEGARVDASLREIDAALARDFPDYAALANPEPLSIAATQALLRDNEALYQLLIGDSASLAWVVTRTEARWAELPAGRQALADDVEALRCGLDASIWTDKRFAAKAERCLTVSPRPDNAGPNGGTPPFDLERAHKLYRTLLGAFDDLIAGRRLLIVPSGPLTTLPPHVLVTQPAQDRFGGYGGAAWLGVRQALTVLPSVASLKAARATPKGEPAPRPFVSFSNPLVPGSSADHRMARAKQSCSALPAGMDGMRGAAGAPESVESLYKGAAVDLARLRAQPPLPGTADEACDVGRYLGANDDDIHLGSRATEARLKALNAAGALAGYRVLHFGTHGFLPDETRYFARRSSEPSLMLTPPEAATEEDDGLLTASEVAALSLNAEAAVLSACNTASASGAHQAEALSGLARAFLYGGTRALLVTHWYVNDDAAAALVKGSFAERRRRPDMPLAEAHREAIRSAIAAGGYRAHPYWWAPFVVVTAD